MLQPLTQADIGLGVGDEEEEEEEREEEGEGGGKGKKRGGKSKQGKKQQKKKGAVSSASAKPKVRAVSGSYLSVWDCPALSCTVLLCAALYTHGMPAAAAVVHCWHATGCSCVTESPSF